jgi:glucose-6-phosphate isomerase, archaeal
MNTTELPTLLEPFGVDFDLEKGVMLDPKNHLVRRASDMRGYYEDAGALEKLIQEQADPVHYEVFEVPVPENSGHLMYCISTLQPGKVGSEYFMTKGHYHSVPGTAEIYLCLRGQGCMMMKTSGGECRTEPMTRGRMVYVPPHWAHRSVNTGSEPLISFCVYPAEAGHNYGDIARQGFPKRIYERDGRTVMA